MQSEGELMSEKSSNDESIGEAFPKEIDRVRTVLEEIGPAGAFSAISIEKTLREADKASLASGDAAEIVKAFCRRLRIDVRPQA